MIGAQAPQRLCMWVLVGGDGAGHDVSLASGLFLLCQAGTGLPAG